MKLNYNIYLKKLTILYGKQKTMGIINFTWNIKVKKEKKKKKLYMEFFVCVPKQCSFYSTIVMEKMIAFKELPLFFPMIGKIN